ncbi:MAG: hypothetical protein R6U64_09780 [Bacteroidales bacterium]
MHLLLLMVGMTILGTESAYGVDYISKASGSWILQETWEGDIPSHTGELKNGDRIFIDHDITLHDQSFLSGANKFELHIGLNYPATLTIEKNFTISNTIDIIVFQESLFIVGMVPPAGYDFCEENATENAMFLVDGSELTPSLQIRSQAKFILYGDFEVKNKFNIEVLPGGLFKVYGGFTAGNTATFSLTGTDAWIGCDMLFDNGAEIFMDVGTLIVGGDLLFGNTAYLTMIGSTINVGGTICSYPGGGFATVYLVGDINNPSTITSLHTCEDVQFENIDGIILPIKLLAFTSRVEKDQVILQWTTATETNNDYFTVGRSHDMHAWEVIGTVSGAGNSNQPLSYQLADRMPYEGISYYRLKQTDFDGAHESFKPLAVEYLFEKNHPNFKVIKSPGQWKVVVPAGETWQVEVHALNGRLLVSQKATGAFYFPAPTQPVVVRILNATTPPLSQIIM